MSYKTGGNAAVLFRRWHPTDVAADVLRRNAIRIAELANML